MAKKSAKKQAKLFFCQRPGCTQFFTKLGLWKNHYHKKCPLIVRKDKFKSLAKSKTNININDVVIKYFIGNGGFGHVWGGSLGKRQVIIKGIQNIKKYSFMRQIQVWNKIKEMGYNNGKYFPFFYAHEEKLTFSLIITERLRQDLWDTFHSKKRSVSFIFKVFQQITQCLQKLHQCGFTHRDIKLNNIMFDGNRAKLIDFGNCGYIPTDKSSKSSVYGDLRFMSIDAHQYLHQIQKDDLESLTYMMMSLFTFDLFWGPVYRLYATKAISLDQAMAEIRNLKLFIIQKCELPEFDRIPQQFFDILKYLRSLKRQEKVEYLRIIQLLNNPNQSKYQHFLSSGKATKIVNQKKLDKQYPLLEFYEYIEGKLTPHPTQIAHDDLMFGLPFHMMQNYNKKIEFGPIQLIKMLEMKGVYVRDYKFIEFENESQLEGKISKTDKLEIYLALKKQPSIYYILLKKRGLVISFNPYDEEQLKFDFLNVQKTKFWKRQSPDCYWKSGYLTYGWMIKILTSGLKKWFDYEVQI